MKRRGYFSALATAVLVAAITVGPPSTSIASAAPTSRIPQFRSDPSVTLPLTGLTKMVVDEAHQHIFLTGATAIEFGTASDSVVVVANFDGTLNTIISGLPGAGGMYLDAAANKLYVAESDGDALRVINTSTLALGATYNLGPGADCPLDVAKASGRIWTVAGCGTNAYDLVAVNISTMAVTTYSFHPGQLLRTDPANSNLLFGGVMDSSPGGAFKFDVSGGTPVQLGETTGATEGWSNMQDLTVSPDGGDLIAASGAPYYLDALKVADLSGDVQYITGPYPVAVTVSADSQWVVGGISGNGGPNVMLFKKGNPNPVNVFSLAETEQVQARGLAMSADNSKLFVVGAPYPTGTPPELTVLPDPTVPNSTLTISEASYSVFMGDPINLSGTLTFADGSSAAGVTVHIVRTDPNSVQTVLPDATTDASGDFSVSDTPSLVGVYTYAASIDPASSHRATDAETSLNVSKRFTTLTLSATRTSVTSGRPTTITASLAGFDPGEVVSISETPYRGTTQVIASGPVDTAGEISVTVSPQAEAMFSATTDGDSIYDPGTSRQLTVSVYPIVAAHLMRYYGRSRGYELYHYTANCPRRGRGCPMFRTVIEPTHAGQCVYLRLEDRGRYGWRGASTSRCFKLDARSESIVIFVYANARIIGRSLRVRAEFVGDRDHLSQVSAWSDFKVTH